MLKRLHFNLVKPYINKSLDIDSMQQVLDKPDSVAYCLYCIKNDVKEIMKFAELNDPEWDLMAHVRVRYALVGAAKRQAWEVKPFSKLIKVKPEYNFICILDSLKEGKMMYYKRFKTTNPDIIYKLVQEAYQDLQLITGYFE
jgi:hypothetical protein